MAGKGDSPRPVNQKKFAENWNHIFKKHKDKNAKPAKSSN